MQRILTLVLGLLGVSIGISWADVQTLQPTVAQALPESEEGWGRALLQFDLSGLPTEAKARMDLVYLEWQASGLGADALAAFELRPVTGEWTLSAVQSGTVPETPSEDGAFDDVTAEAFGRAQAKFDLQALARSWAANPALNHGVIVSSDVLTSTQLADQLAGATLGIVHPAP